MRIQNWVNSGHSTHRNFICTLAHKLRSIIPVLLLALATSLFASSVSAATLSGTIVDAADGVTGISPVDVSLLDVSTGDDPPGLEATTDANGFYEITGIPEGDWKVMINAFDTANGYVDELYNEIPCDDGGCDRASQGEVITIGAGVNTLDEELDVGYRFSGTIDDTMGPGGNGYVKIYQEGGDGGALLYDIWPDGSGYYESPILPPANYITYAYGEDFGHVTELYDGIACPWGHCDYLAWGTFVDLNSGDQTGIDFDLAPQSYDWVISGTITTAGGGAAQGGAVQIFAPDGQHMGDFWVDENGYWETHQLTNGYYKAITVYTNGVMDEAWDAGDGIACPNRACDYLSVGHEITVDGGNVGGIDFVLDPSSGGTISGTVTRDGGATTLSSIRLDIYNSNGQYIDTFYTDDSGNYQTRRFADGDLYLRTVNLPAGLAPEFWNDVHCTPNCDDSGWIVSNATAVSISGADQTGVNFDSELPVSGYTISGDVHDEELGHILPDVNLVLFNSNGDEIARASSGADGSYYFIGLSNGDYRIYADGVPNNYDQELFGDFDCPGWSCDFAADGDPITVSDANNDGNNITLDYNGTRIFGTITRSDTGAPVGSQIAGMWVDLYDTSGAGVGDAYTNIAGQYSFDVGAGDYRMSTNLDVNYHGLLREYWTAAGGNHCDVAYGCDAQVGDIVTVDGINTPVADFELDPGATISGHVSGGGSGLGGVEVCVTRRDGWYLGCTRTQTNGDYVVKGLPFELDVIPFINDTGGHPFSNEAYGGVPHGDWGNATGVDIDDGQEENVDFALAAGYSISGIITSGGSPLEGIGVCIHYKSNSEFTGVCGGSDASGNYTTDKLPAGSDYIAYAIGDNQGYERQVWDHQACTPWCDFEAGTAITLVPGDATGVDFEIGISNPGTISGHILDHNLNPNPGGGVNLYDRDGNYFDHFGVDENGYWETYPIPTGSYYAVTRYTYGVIDARWDGGEGSPCPNQLCNPMEGNAIDVSSGLPYSDINFVLQPITSGGQITGHVEDASNNPLANVVVVFSNSNGEYVQEVRTNLNGDYQSAPVTDDVYYVATRSGPLGLGAELFDDLPCYRRTVCEDPGYVTANGTQIVVAGTDYSGVDFVLGLPVGFIISGKVTDADLGAPLPGVDISLNDEFGNYLDEVQTDEFGDYYFSGMENGSYRLYTNGVPEGYSRVLYNGVDCPDWSCDFGAEGTPVIVSNADVPGSNIGLTYTGTRIFGTVTRADNGQPVSSEQGYMGVNLFDASGNQIGGTSTNNAGQYQLHLPGAGDYYLLTNHDTEFHGLVDECWDDIACFDNYDPVGQGATLISVNQDSTVVADFELDSATTLSGRVTDSSTGLPIEGVQLDIQDAFDNYITSVTTDSNGDYSFAIQTPGDYLVFIPPYGAPSPYLPQVWPGIFCNFYVCDLAGTGSYITVGSSSVNGKDFALDAGNNISGVILDADTTNPIEGVNVCVHRTSGEWTGVCGYADASGYYETWGLTAGTAYVAYALGEDFGYERQIWDHQACSPTCDFASGTPISVGPGNATGISFDISLLQGHAISGQVTDADTSNPVEGAEVWVFHMDYSWTGVSVTTDATGNYSTGSSLLDDDYLVYVEGYHVGYEFQMWDSVACIWWNCDLSLATPLTISSADAGGIDFSISQVGSISGVISSSVTNDVYPNGRARLYASDGSWVALATTDENGFYELDLVSPGTYYVLLTPSNDYLIDSLYDGPGGSGVYCPRMSCDYSQGVQIVVSPGEVITGIDGTLDPGSRISGTVLDGGNPVDFFQTWIYTPTTPVGTSSVYAYSAADGTYQSYSGFPAGSYYVSTADADSTDIGYPHMVYDNILCGDPCDLTQGSLIVLDGVNDATGIDFNLTPNTLDAVISGTVTADDGGAPIGNVKVCVGNQTDTGFKSCAISGVSGNYEVTGLTPLTDYVVYTEDVGGQAFYREMYDSQDCCDVANGTPVDVTGGNATIDFGLASSGRISGFVKDAATDIGIGDVWMLLMDENCQQVQAFDTYTDDGAALGSYAFTGLADGIYYVYAVGDPQGYISEIYPDIKWVAACDPENRLGQAFVIDNKTQVDGVDFALDLGGSISGFVSDANGLLDNGIGSGRLYGMDGELIATAGNNNADNSFTIGGLMPGSYQVVLSSSGLGLVDERYDDVPCPRNSCDPALGTVVTVGPAEHVTGIDAVLEQGAVIRGRITDKVSGDGLPYFYLAIYNSAGIFAGFTGTDENGYYESFTGFPDGDYYLSNQFLGDDGVAGGYLPQVWTNDGSFGACGDPCDPILGDAITVSGTAAIENISMALETGSVIRGSVTTSGATPLTGFQVQLRNSFDGDIIRTGLTDGSGNYEFAGVGSGTYFVRTKNVQGFADRLYNGISCNPYCNPLAGTPVVLDGSNDANGISFTLLPTPTITGSVKDGAGVAISGVKVQAFDSLGSLVATTISNGSGAYTLSNLYAGSFYVKTLNTSGYLDGMYSGLSCAPGCDPLVGTAVSVPGGATVANIDLVLGGASVITGTVTDGTNPLSGVTIEVYRDTGAFVKSVLSDGSGSYTVGGLAFGDYHAVSRNAFGYIDEGSNGTVCQSGCLPTSTSLITVGVNDSVQRNFSLDLGGKITGQAVDSGSTGLQGITVRAYNASGVQVSSANTGPAGTYTISGLAAGNVYLRTTNSNGYRNRRYNNLDCGSGCDVLMGTAVSVALGSTTSNINFTMALGGSISGQVKTGASVGIPGVQVQAYTSAGVFVSFAVTDSTGAYSITGLDDGDYRLKSVNSAGYIDKILGGDSCSPQRCELPSGAISSVASSNLTGVDFVLAQGTFISGVATDTLGIPLPAGTAVVYSSTGQEVKTGAISNGGFSVNGLANGTYYLLMRNNSGLVDQLWQAIDCPGGSCNIVTGEPIVLSSAPAAVQWFKSVIAAVGFDQPQNTTSGSGLIEFELAKGSLIKGLVKDSDNKPVQFKKVYFFDSTGASVGEATTDGLGDFVSTNSFPDGTYFAATSRAALLSDTDEEAGDAEDGIGLGLQDQAWNGFACAGICAPSTSSGFGTSIVISGSDATGIDFVLTGAPEITLEKLTNGVDADSPDAGDAPQIVPGAPVTWTYQLTNTGGADLISVSVVDDQGVVVSCPKATLAMGESINCTGSENAEDLSADPFTGVMGVCGEEVDSRLYQNTGTVTAETAEAVQVSDSDTSHYCNAELKPEVIFSDSFD